MEEFYTSIALVEKNMINKTVGNRKTLIILPINREPPITYVNYEFNVLQQAKKYPKLKMFFPELYK